MRHNPSSLHRLALSLPLALILCLASSPTHADELSELSFLTEEDKVFVDGMRSYSLPASAPVVSDPASVVSSPVVGVGRGVVVEGVGSADEWNRVLAECLAHAASGPVLLAHCRVVLGLDSPQADETGESEDEALAPMSVEALSPQEVVEYARAQQAIGGAGLAWQPKNHALVDLPMLVHASQPAQTLTLGVFGQEVVVEVEAARFSYDFGDGSPALVTSDPSAPYPVKTLNHVYTSASQGTVITLETTWNARITYPSGRSAYVANALTTTETSTPIIIQEADISITALDAN